MPNRNQELYILCINNELRQLAFDCLLTCAPFILIFHTSELLLRTSVLDIVGNIGSMAVPMLELRQVNYIPDLLQTDFSQIFSPITTTLVRISAWAYLKGVSSSTSLHYLWRSLVPLGLSYAQKWP